MAPVVGIREQALEDLAAMGQRVGRLEQRHHVERRETANDPARGDCRHNRPRRQFGKIENAKHVFWGSREADHIAMASLFPEPPLHGCDGSERGHDFARGHAGHELPGEVGRSAPADHQGSESLLVHFGVLPDLEGGEMEPERLDLPAQVLDLPEGHSSETVGHERCLQFVDLVEKPTGRLVATAHGSRRFGEVGTGPT